MNDEHRPWRGWARLASLFTALVLLVTPLNNIASAQQIPALGDNAGLVDQALGLIADGTVSGYSPEQLAKVNGLSQHAVGSTAWFQDLYQTASNQEESTPADQGAELPPATDEPDPPTEVVTEVPTEVVTEIPTEVPTEVPTDVPTEVPTEEPTEVVTEEPTEVVTEEPTEPATETATATKTASATVTATATKTPPAQARGSFAPAAVGTSGSFSIEKTDLLGNGLANGCFSLNATIVGGIGAVTTTVVSVVNSVLGPILLAIPVVGSILLNALVALLTSNLAGLTTTDSGSVCTAAGGLGSISGLFDDVIFAISDPINDSDDLTPAEKENAIRQALAGIAVQVTVSETSAPTGYQLNAAPQVVNTTLEDLVDGVASVTVENTPNVPVVEPGDQTSDGGSVAILKIDALTGLPLAGVCFDIGVTVLGDVLLDVTTALTATLTALLSSLGFLGAILNTTLANLLNPLLAPLNATLDDGGDTQTQEGCSGINGQIQVDGLLADLVNGILFAVGGLLDQTGIDALLASINIDLNITETEPPDGYEGTSSQTTISLLDLLNGNEQTLANNLENPPTAVPTGTPADPDAGSVTVIKLDALTGLPLAGVCFTVGATVVGDVLAAVTSALTLAVGDTISDLLPLNVVTALINSLINPLLAPLSSALALGTSDTSQGCTGAQGEIVIDGLLSTILNAILTAVGGILDQTGIDALLDSLTVNLNIGEDAPLPGYEGASGVPVTLSLLDLLNGSSSTTIENSLTDPPTPIPTGTPGGADDGSVTIIKIDALTGLPLAGVCFTLDASVLTSSVLATVQSALTIALGDTISDLLPIEIVNALIEDLIEPLLSPLEAILGVDATAESTESGCTGADGTIVIDGLLSDVLNAILVAVGGILDQTQINDLLAAISSSVTITEDSPLPGYENSDPVTVDLNLLQLLTGSDQTIENTLSEEPTPVPTGTPGGVDDGSVTIIKLDALTGLPLAGVCFTLDASVLTSSVLATVQSALTVALGETISDLLPVEIVNAILQSLITPLLAPLQAILGVDATAESTGAGCTGADGEIIIDGLLSEVLNGILVAVGGILDETEINDLLAAISSQVTITEDDALPGYEDADPVVVNLNLLQLLTGTDQTIENDLSNTPTPVPTGTPTDGGGSVTIIKIDALSELPLAGVCFTIGADLLNTNVLALVQSALTVAIGDDLNALLGAIPVNVLNQLISDLLEPLLAPLSSIVGIDGSAETTSQGCTGANGTIVIEGLLSEVLNGVLVAVGGILDQTQINNLLAAISSEVLITEDSPLPGYENSDPVTLTLNLLQLLTGVDQTIENEPLATETATATSTATGTATSTATTTPIPTGTPTGGGEITIIKIDALSGLPLAGACFDIDVQLLGSVSALAAAINTLIINLLGPILGNTVALIVNSLVGGLTGDDLIDNYDGECSGLDGNILLDSVLSSVLNPILQAVGGVLTETQLNELLDSLQVGITITETTPPAGYEGMGATTVQISLLDLLFGHDETIENTPLTTPTTTPTTTTTPTETPTGTPTETPIPTGTPTGGGEITIIKIDALSGLPLAGACFDIDVQLLGSVSALATAINTLVVNLLGPVVGGLVATIVNSLVGGLTGDDLIDNYDGECSGLDGNILLDSVLSSVLNPILQAVGGVLTETQLNELLDSLQVGITITETTPPPGYEGMGATTVQISLLDLLFGHDETIENTPLTTPTTTPTTTATPETPTATPETPTATPETPTTTPTPPPTGTPTDGGEITIIKIDALSGLPLAGACFDIDVQLLGSVSALAAAINTLIISLLGPVVGNAVALIVNSLVGGLTGDDLIDNYDGECSGLDGNILLDSVLSSVLNPILQAVGGVLTQTQLNELLDSLQVGITITETTPPPGYEGMGATTVQISLLDLLFGHDETIENTPLTTPTTTPTTTATPETPTATPETPTATPTTTTTPTATPTGTPSDGGSVTIIKIAALGGNPLADACFDIDVAVLSSASALAATVNGLIVQILGQNVLSTALQAILTPLLTGLGLGDLTDGDENLCTGINGQVTLSGLLSEVINPILVTLGGVLTETQINQVLDAIQVGVTITEVQAPAGYDPLTEAVVVDISLLDLLFGFDREIQNNETATPTPTVTPTVTVTATPETPTATPETPTATPETPTATPETPTATPETPTATPETPTATPETPTATPETPTATPETPTATPETPTATPETPTATPETPTATPETPTATPETPTATPETPTATPETPTATPETPTATPTQTATPEIADIVIYVIRCESNPGVVTVEEAELDDLPADCELAEGVIFTATIDGVPLAGGPFVSDANGRVIFQAPVGSTLVVTEDVDSVNSVVSTASARMLIQVVPGRYEPLVNPITFESVAIGDSAVFVNVRQGQPTETPTATPTSTATATPTATPSKTPTATPTTPVKEFPNTGSGLDNLGSGSSQMAMNWMLAMLMALFMLMLALFRFGFGRRDEENDPSGPHQGPDGPGGMRYALAGAKGSSSSLACARAGIGFDRNGTAGAWSRGTENVRGRPPRAAVPTETAITSSHLGIVDHDARSRGASTPIAGASSTTFAAQVKRETVRSDQTQDSIVTEQRGAVRKRVELRTGQASGQGIGRSTSRKKHRGRR